MSQQSQFLEAMMTNLILGGTGKTGRRIVERLVGRGLPVRIATRSSDTRFHWEEPNTWDEALLGITAAYIVFTPDPEGRRAETILEPFVRRAESAGVRRLVFLSGRNEPAAQKCEAVIRAASIPWTILQPSWFNQNFSEDFLYDGVTNGEVVLPVGDVPEPFVDADDIADVAVSALIDPGHAERAYELTGPDSLTFAEATAQIGAALGREIGFRTVPWDEYESIVRRFGVQEDEIKMIKHLFTTLFDGRNVKPANGVYEAIGRPPREFAAYVHECIGNSAWNKTQTRHGS